MALNPKTGARRRAACLLACALLPLACTTGTSGADAGGVDAGCDVFDGGPLDPSLVSQGSALVTEYLCQQCHGTYLEGNADGLQLQDSRIVQYPRNLTPEPVTGLGCWSYDQIASAILYSVDNEGNSICGPMPRFAALGMSLSEAEAIAVYLRSVPPEPVNIPSGPGCSCNTDSDCPPMEICLDQGCTCYTLACALPGQAGGDGGPEEDGGFEPAPDGGEDAGPADGGLDGGSRDGGTRDAGAQDGGGLDAGHLDGGIVDAGLADAGLADAGALDAGRVDAGPTDAGQPPAGDGGSL